MTGKRWIDVELILDGTARWLWVIRSEAALLGAGVAMSRTDAQRVGEEVLLALGARQDAARAILDKPGWKTDSLNLDELERLDREERQQRGPDRGRGPDQGDVDGHTLIV